MNKGGNRVQIPLLLLVIPHEKEQIKNLGNIHLEKRNIKFPLNVGGVTCHVD